MERRIIGHIELDSRHCLATDCEVEVEPRFLMCPRHWRMVPPRLQQAVRSNYQPGQERTRRVSRAWLEAAAEAQTYVAKREGKHDQPRPSQNPDSL